MSPLALSKKVLQNYEKASRLEWIETNGLGGFAAQSVLGSHNWRYHGLLFGSLRPPVQRILFLSKVEETLMLDGVAYELSTNQYENKVHPEGYKYLESFRLDPFPVWEFKIGSIRLKKTLFMTHGKNEVTLIYEILGSQRKPVELILKPLVAFRGIHALTGENPAFKLDALENENCVVIHPYAALPPMSMWHNGTFDGTARTWYKRFQYKVERERQNPEFEDLFCAGDLKFTLAKNTPAFLVANLDEEGSTDIAAVRALEKQEKRRRTGLDKKSDSEFVRTLKRAADQFIVIREGKATIIAGYPWFADWGRDSFIALPGLMLETGRFEAAREIIESFIARMKQGIIPNTFPEVGQETLFNTADASLWLIIAVSKYMLKTRDKKFIKEIYGALKDVVFWYQKGTLNGIRMDESDALITQGYDGLALTWMDAVVNGTVVTPRRGKTVEINALWFASLEAMHRLAKFNGARKDAEIFGSLAERVKENFTLAFWNERRRCLFDRIDADGTQVDELRPNQIFAVSLSADLLSHEHQKAIFAAVKEEFLTPFGLRSLSRGHPDYRKKYIGDLLQRDTAYHQGTVWGYLIGPYCEALLTVKGKTFKAKKEIRALIKKFEPHLRDACMGQCGEIFDAEEPFTPRGCPAQAWTVAELLRIEGLLR